MAVTLFTPNASGEMTAVDTYWQLKKEVFCTWF